MEKPILNFEDYSITDDGIVISYKNSKKHILSPWKDSQGKYLYVSLMKNGEKTNRSIHSLVAEAFVEGKKKIWLLTTLIIIFIIIIIIIYNGLLKKENVHKTYATMSQIRNKRTTDLYYKDEYVDTFISVKDAIRYASKYYGVSPTSLEKYGKSGNCKIEKV